MGKTTLGKLKFYLKMVSIFNFFTQKIRNSLKWVRHWSGLQTISVIIVQFYDCG